MFHLLIVDDDPRQLRLLGRVFTARGSNLQVSTAAGGREAIKKLEKEPIDIVLTDLQMPEVNGFELIAWMLSNRPHIPAFAMTAFPDVAAVGRLQELGSLHCFTKPLDVPNVLERLAETAASVVEGRFRSIGLAAFLQLLLLERKTCAVRVRAGDDNGQLYVESGAVVHACTSTGEAGAPAAYRILSWNRPAITIVRSHCPAEKNIEVPTPFLLMEAARLMDENMSGHTHMKSCFAGPIEMDDDDVFAVIDTKTGDILRRTGEFPQIEGLARMLGEFYRVKSKKLGEFAPHETIGEVAISGRSWGLVARPQPEEPDLLAAVIYETSRANLALQRHALDGFIQGLREESLSECRNAGGDPAASIEES